MLRVCTRTNRSNYTSVAMRKKRRNEEERSRSAAETKVPIVHRAVSTSGGYGFCFDQEERFNRLLLVRIRLLLPHINVARVHLKNAAGAVLNLAPMVVACQTRSKGESE